MSKKWLLPLFFTPFVILWLVRLVTFIHYPQIEYSEGFMAWNAMLFGAGWNWDATSGPPYNTSFYTPLSYFLNFDHNIISARIISLASTISIVISISLIVKHFTQSKFIAVVAALLPFTQPSFTSWSYLGRVDSLGVAFTLMGLLGFVKIRGQQLRGIGIGCLVCAWLTKQTMVAGSIAVWLDSFVENRRSAIVAALVVLSLVLVTGGLLWWQKPDIIRQLFLYQQTVPMWRNGWSIVSSVILGFIPMLPLAILACKGGMREHRLFVFWAIGAAVIDLAIFARTGASTNYHIELIAALSILAGIGLHRFWKYSEFFPLVRDRITVAAQLSILCIPLTGFFLIANTTVPLPTQSYLTAYNQAKTIIVNPTYPIITENAGLVLDCGGQPYYEPFVYTNLTKLGYFDESRLLDDLNTGRVQYIVASHELPFYKAYRFSENVQQAIVANYSIVYKYLDSPNSDFSIIIYEPKATAIKSDIVPPEYVPSTVSWWQFVPLFGVMLASIGIPIGGTLMTVSKQKQQKLKQEKQKRGRTRLTSMISYGVIAAGIFTVTKRLEWSLLWQSVALGSGLLIALGVDWLISKRHGG